MESELLTTVLCSVADGFATSFHPPQIGCTILARHVHELLVDPVHGRTERSFELRAFRSNKYRTKLGETTVNKGGGNGCHGKKNEQLRRCYCVRDAGSCHVRRPRSANVGIGGCESSI
jgi:hypothetical protein